MKLKCWGLLVAIWNKLKEWVMAKVFIPITAMELKRRIDKTVALVGECRMIVFQATPATKQLQYPLSLRVLRANIVYGPPGTKGVLWATCTDGRVVGLSNGLWVIRAAKPPIDAHIIVAAEHVEIQK